MAPHPQSEGGSSESGSVSSQHPYSRRGLKSLARELQAVGDDAGRQEGSKEMDHQAAVEPPAPPLLDKEGPPQPPEAPRGNFPLPLHDDELVDGTDVSIGGQEQDAAEKRGAAAAEEAQPQLQPAPTTVHDGEAAVQQETPPGPAAELSNAQLQELIARLQDEVTSLKRQQHNDVAGSKGTSHAERERTSDAASSDWYRSMPRTIQESDNDASSDPSSSAFRGGREGTGAGGGRGAVFWEDRYHHLLSMFNIARAADPHFDRRINDGPTAITLINATYRCFIQRHRYLACLRAAVKIEALLRGARLRVRLRRAAVKVQSAWRGFVGYSLFVQQRRAWVKLQSAVRGGLVRGNNPIGKLLTQKRIMTADMADKEAQLTTATADLADKEVQLTTAKTEMADKEAQLTTATADLASMKTLLAQLLPSMSSSDKNQALLEAANKGTQTAVKALIEGGADVHSKNNDKSTPLQKAAGYNSNAEVVRALLDAGADIHAKNNRDSTPLHYAANYNPNVEVLQALLDAGADIHDKNNFGNTALHYAAWTGRLAHVELLCARGADITIKNNDGKTALQWAQGDNHSTVVAFLQQQQ